MELMWHMVGLGCFQPISERYKLVLI